MAGCDARQTLDIACFGCGEVGLLAACCSAVTQRNVHQACRRSLPESVTWMSRRSRFVIPVELNSQRCWSRFDAESLGLKPSWFSPSTGAIAAIMARRAAMAMQCRLERDTAIMATVAQAALGNSGSVPE
jgi:hypothetical protein